MRTLCNVLSAVCALGVIGRLVVGGTDDVFTSALLLAWIGIATMWVNIYFRDLEKQLKNHDLQV